MFNTEKKSWKSVELRKLEKQIQDNWLKTDAYKTRIIPHHNKYTFFATFPYPYMNGDLHLGHGFTMSKYDFICKFYRMLGYDVLQPFSFHLTGMPIVAAADKLKYELQLIGNNRDSTISFATQYINMKQMNINDNDIQKFIDPLHWGNHFSETAKHTLKRFGISYDDSRSFKTTDQDQFYDRFIKWQFTILYKKNVLKFGTRYDLFSIKDNQSCLGHERSTGENAKPQKSYLIMFKICNTDIDNVSDTPALSIIYNKYQLTEDIPIFMIINTTRPETIYGVTNLWVNKNGIYKIYLVETNKSYTYWICQEYNIISLQHQYRNTDNFYIKNAMFIADIDGNTLTNFNVVNKIKHNDIILPIFSLNYQGINNLLQIDTNIGTGIVMSVPSDSLIDYLGYLNVINDYKIGKLKNQPLDITPLIHIDSLEYKIKYSGDKIVVDIIDEHKIVNSSGYSTIDNKIMSEIKSLLETSINDKTIMNIDDPFNNIYKGMSIIEARMNIKNSIIYYEPDEKALSRTNDKLIVAKMDQWYIDYGDKKWTEDAHQHLEQMKFNDNISKNSLKIAINWLDQWPCSRTYGLGSTFPELINNNFNSEEKECIGNKINNNHIIDSLSDSTIYMALYTIYHYFKDQNIIPEELTNDVFDYIFLLKNYNDERYNRFTPLREEFIHWYPFDLRVSAKDLMMNHLAMCIFNHVMIWDNEFKQRLSTYYPNKNIFFGPVSYEINGYIVVKKPGIELEIEKMSKSKGNFKTLDMAINTYSSDALRFTFASAQSGSDDAYFDQDLCTKMIEKIYKEKEWILSIINNIDNVSNINENMSYLDTIFMNEMALIMKEVIQHYKDLNFREVVTKGFHTMQSLRDNYIEMQSDVNQYLIKTFIRNQLWIMYPIMPHFCEYFTNNSTYRNVINNNNDPIILTQDITNDINFIDNKLHQMHMYISDIASSIIKRIFKLNKKKSITKVSIFCAGEITDPIEKIVINIIKNNNNYERNITATQIIAEANIINPIFMNNNIKYNEMVIKYFRKVEEIISRNGYEWYTNMITNKFSEYQTLKKYIKYYIKYDPIRDLYFIENKNSFQIMFIDYTFEYAKQHNEISGVRYNEPVIHYK